MLVLAMLGDYDDKQDDEIRGDIDYGLDEVLPLDSPPRIISLEEGSIGLLPKVIESINLFH
jgi:hypothetical protein